MPFISTGSGGNKVVPFFGGAQCQNPANVIQKTTNPGSNGTSEPIGTIWINTSTGASYQLVTQTSTSATWAILGGGTSDVNTLTGDSGGAISPTGGTITLAGGTGISTSGSGSTITYNVVGGGLKTTVVSGTTQAAAINNRYVPNNAGTCTVTLPATAAVGSAVVVDGLGAGGWVVAQNASQVINSPGGSTTIGAGGSLASTNRYDSVTLICVVANTTWTIENMVGVITIV